jgi:hypothetical protein
MCCGCAALQVAPGRSDYTPPKQPSYISKTLSLRSTFIALEDILSYDHVHERKTKVRPGAVGTLGPGCACARAGWDCGAGHAHITDGGNTVLTPGGRVRFAP